MRVHDLLTRLESLAALQAALLSRIALTVEGAAKKEAPVKTGTLRRSITHSVEATKLRARIGTNISYARAVHDGVRATTITAKDRNGRRGYLKFKIGGRTLYRPTVHIPARKGNPFLTRGLAVSRDSITRILADEGAKLWARVAR